MPAPTACTDFYDNSQVASIYYDEMINLVKQASGADRVFIFDHTIRQSGNTNLNPSDGGSAAPVPRVHCDYTHDGAPRRLLQLAETKVWSYLQSRALTQEDFE